jgi:chitin disaccharide deacetylase
MMALGIRRGSVGMVAILLTLAGSDAAPQGRSDRAPIRLVVRADDMGSSHAANLACIQCYQKGIVRSIEVITPGPWFAEAAKLLKENPGCDVGVHLTLNSEWDLCKWGPLTRAPSLVDTQGYFYPSTSQRPDFPPHTGFLESGWKIEEVEKELRAQIELARKMIPQVSHLSSHMYTITATPQLTELVQRLAKEYKLPFDTPGAQTVAWTGDGSAPAATWEASLIQAIGLLQPGVWLLVEHPGFDTPEMQALGHTGYRNVASHRNSVTKAFTSPKVKTLIKKRNIQLVAYRDIWS